jgi:hypothetical protein
MSTSVSFAVRIKASGKGTRTCFWQKRLVGFEIAFIGDISDGVHRRRIFIYECLTLPGTKMSLFEMSQQLKHA